MSKAPKVFRPSGWQPRSTQQASAHKRGYTRSWQKASKLFLKAHPLCIECKGQGIIRGADCVDHIVPHKGDKSVFWDQDNWQPLCTHCHGVKTARGE